MSAAREWPQAHLDAVTRLRVLAAALPDCHLEETLIPASFDAVWGIAGDLEAGVPRFEGNVRSIEILRSEGTRIELEARGALGKRIRYEAQLQPGWCLMRSRFTDIGMAATPVDAHTTRFAHFEGVTAIGRFTRPLLRRSIRADLERLAALAAAEER